MDIQIRQATAADQRTIVDFNSKMAVETEGRTLDPDRMGPGVAALLADVTRGRYWLAIIDGEIAGQLLITYEWSDWHNGRYWWIQSVYVPARFRRRGVFSALYKHVESMAQADQDACGLRLYVETGNERAQETYRAIGMKKPGYLVMESIFTEQGMQKNAESR